MVEVMRASENMSDSASKWANFIRLVFVLCLLLPSEIAVKASCNSAYNRCEVPLPVMGLSCGQPGADTTCHNNCIMRPLGLTSNDRGCSMPKRDPLHPDICCCGPYEDLDGDTVVGDDEDIGGNGDVAVPPDSESLAQAGDATAETVVASPSLDPENDRDSDGTLGGD